MRGREGKENLHNEWSGPEECLKHVQGVYCGALITLAVTSKSFYALVVFSQGNALAGEIYSRARGESLPCNLGQHLEDNNSSLILYLSCCIVSEVAFGGTFVFGLIVILNIAILTLITDHFCTH